MESYSGDMSHRRAFNWTDTSPRFYWKEGLGSSGQNGFELEGGPVRPKDIYRFRSKPMKVETDLVSFNPFLKAYVL